MIRSARPTNHRLEFIDGLRAIAVLLVFVTHSTEVFSTLSSPRGQWLARLAHDLDFGRIGVVAFFAISGFLIPSSLHGPCSTGTIRFVVHRLFRLYPAFWLSVVACAAAFYWLPGQGIPGRSVLANLSMIPEAFGVDYINPAYWTLEVELIFYSICLFLFLGDLIGNTVVLSSLMVWGFFMYLSSQMVFFGGALNPALSAHAVFIYLHLCCMFWGAMLRRWHDGAGMSLMPKVFFLAVCFYWFVYFPACSLVASVRAGHVVTDTRLLSGYAFGLLMFLLAFLRRPSFGRVLAWIGRISYSLYLLHAPAMALAAWIVSESPLLQRRRLETYVVLSLALSVLLAHASYVAVEKPFIGLGSRMGRFLVRKTRADLVLPANR